MYIRIWGTEAQIRESWFRVRGTIAELWELHNLATAGKASIDVIVKEIGRTFPPEALVYALKLKGYSASYDNETNTVATNAPLNVVIETAKRIAEIIDSLAYRTKGTAIKRLIAAVAAGLDEDIDRVIEYGLRMRIFTEEDERIVLREEWRRAVRKLAVMLKPQTGLDKLD